MQLTCRCFSYAISLVVCSFLALPAFPNTNNSETAKHLAVVKNPVIFADFSDPDVIRQGDTYYMVASSFNHMPGVPVLRSPDLINWERIAYVMQNHPLQEHFALPRHGDGMWAPCIRYHNGKYWVFMPDPDFGIYVSSAKNPVGPWSEPHLLLPGAGIIDPTPLWDTDGNAYLLHGWAKSRSGVNNRLTLHRMSEDAQTILDDGVVLINGDDLAGYRTLEGPKFYKRNGYYYISAPAGGVSEGWQSVFRARNIYGPYESKVTLETGTTAINGPHQGAWVTDPNGQDWFFHFQDRDAFGRIVHLQPVNWQDDWPIIGVDIDGNGVGEPVLDLAISTQTKTIAGLSTSDNFESELLGLQWQWNANWEKRWYSLSENPGNLRLFAQLNRSNLWHQPAIVSQMFYGPAFEAHTKLTLGTTANLVDAGLLIYGYDYAWLGLKRRGNSYELVYTTCLDTLNNCMPQTLVIKTVKEPEIELKVAVQEENALYGQQTTLARFYYRSVGAKEWQPVNLPDFVVKPGRWVGARVGLFVQQSSELNSKEINSEAVGFADIDYFNVVIRNAKAQNNKH